MARQWKDDEINSYLKTKNVTKSKYVAPEVQMNFTPKSTTSSVASTVDALNSVEPTVKMTDKQINSYIKSKNVSANDYVAPTVQMNYEPQQINILDNTQLNNQSTIKTNEEKPGYFTKDGKLYREDLVSSNVTGDKDTYTYKNTEITDENEKNRILADKSLNIKDKTPKKSEYFTKNGRLYKEELDHVEKDKNGEHFVYKNVPITDKAEKEKIYNDNSIYVENRDEKFDITKQFKNGYQFGDIYKTGEDLLTKKFVEPLSSTAESFIEDPKGTLGTIIPGTLQGIDEGSVQKINKFVDNLLLAGRNKDTEDNIQNMDVNTYNRLVNYGTEEEKKKYYEQLKKDYSLGKVTKSEYNMYKEALTGPDTRSELAKKVDKVLDYDYQQSEAYKKAQAGELDPGKQFLYENSSQIGSQLVPMAASAVTGNPYVGKALFWTQATQGYMDEAEQRGYTGAKKYIYGGVMGTVESLVEEMGFDQFAGLDKIAEESLVKSVMGEMAEEAVTPYFDYAVRYILGTNDYTLGEATNDAIDGAVSAAFTTAILSGGSKGIASVDNVINKLSNNQSVTQQEIHQAIQDLQEQAPEVITDNLNIYLDELKQTGNFEQEEQQEQIKEEVEQNEIEDTYKALNLEEEQELEDEELENENITETTPTTTELELDLETLLNNVNKSEVVNDLESYIEQNNIQNLSQENIQDYIEEALEKQQLNEETKEALKSKYNDIIQDYLKDQNKNKTPEEIKPLAEVVLKENDTPKSTYKGNKLELKEDSKKGIRKPSEIAKDQYKVGNELEMQYEGHEDVSKGRLRKSAEAFNFDKGRPFTQREGNYLYIEHSNSIIDAFRRDAATYFKNVPEARQFAKVAEKIIKDKNVAIRLDSNLKSKDGRIANASYNNGVITINPNSSRSLEFLLAHELTHAIGTKSMLNMIENYRKSNSEFDNAVKKLLGTYKASEINEEALADVSGQLFGNQEFINNLANEKPSMFKKIYNEIKYLWHQVRGYKNQNEFIQDLYNKWTDAYNNNFVKRNGNVKGIKNSQEEVNNQTFYHGGNKDFDMFNSTRKPMFGDHNVNFLTNNKDIAKTYGENVKELKTNVKNPYILDGNTDGYSLEYSNTAKNEIAENKEMFNSIKQKLDQNGGDYYKKSVYKIGNNILENKKNILTQEEIDYLENHPMSLAYLSVKAKDGFAPYGKSVMTNDVVNAVLSINDTIGNKYDSVLFKDIRDSGQNYDENSLTAKSDVLAFFDNNQIQDNTKFSVEDLKLAKNEEKDKFNGYTQKEIDNIESNNIKIASNEEDITSYAKDILNKKNTAKKLYVGKVKSKIADFISKNLGINLDGYNISINRSGIEHSMSHHGKETELLRGQVPLTEDDFKKIPEIINNADNITRGYDTRHNKPTIIFEKNIDGNNIVATYVSDKHHNLELQTMYKFKNNKKTNSFTGVNESKDSLTSTPKANSDTNLFDNNISQNNKNVKLDENAKRYEDLTKTKYIEYFTKDNGDVRINLMDSNNNLVNQFDLYNQREAISQLGENLGKQLYQNSSVDNQRFEIGNDINNMGTETDYFMTHRPTESGITADDLTGQGKEFGLPNDIYEHPEYYSINKTTAKETMDQLNKVRNNPDADVTIYRATTGNKINKGDWVTLSKSYAEQHNQSQFDGKGNIIEKVVKARDIQNAGDMLDEWGYFPEDTTKNSKENESWREYVEREFPASGTRTDLDTVTGRKRAKTTKSTTETKTTENKASNEVKENNLSYETMQKYVNTGRDTDFVDYHQLDNGNIIARAKDGTYSVIEGNKVIVDGQKIPTDGLYMQTNSSMKRDLLDLNDNDFRDVKYSTEEGTTSKGNKVKVKQTGDNVYEVETKPTKNQIVPDMKNETIKVGDKKVSNFYSNVTEKSKFITEENRESLKDNENIQYYDAISNKETLNDALDKLNSDPDQTVGDFFTKTDFTAEDVATGWILAKRYQDAGNFEAMSNVLEKMREQGTKSGQAIQMFGMLERLTPEGMEYYAQKQLDNAYNKFTKNKSKQQIDKYANDFTLTAEEHQFIKDQMEKVQSLEDEDAKKVEIAKIVRMLSDKIPPESGQRTKAWMRIAMLGNPKTQVRNVMGNAIIQPVNWVGDIFSTAVDKAISKKTGIRTKGNTDFGVLAGGFVKGGKEAIRDAKLGIDTRDINLNRFEENIGAKPFYEGHKSKALNAGAKALNKVNDILGNVMSGGDRVFYQAIYDNSLKNQMKANNVTTPTQSMIDIATQEALSRTWNDSNAYTKAVLQIRNAMNKLNVKGYGLGDVLVPFAKTPANLTKAIVDYSPAGLVKSILADGRNLRNSLQNGQYNAELQHKFADSLGKGVAGSMLYVAAAALAKAGVITGASDDDKDVANFMRNTLGVQPYSVKIGNKSFTYDWAQPIAAPFAIAADAKRLTKEENRDLESVLNTATNASINILLDQSFLSSVQDVFNSYQGPTAAIKQQIEDLPARATPTFFKQIADLIDPTQRQTYVKGNEKETVKNKVQTKIPVASKELTEQRDTLGREIKKYGGDENKLKYAFNVFLNPANTNKGKTSEAAQEIYDVYKATGDKTVMPRQVGYSENVGGETRNLTAKERSEWQKLSGEKVEESVAALANNSKYQAMSDEDKAAVLNGIVNYSFAKAKSDVFDVPMSSMYKTAAKKEEQGIPIYDYYVDRVAKRK